MNNLLDLQSDLRIVMNSIIAHQNEIVEITTKKSGSRKRSRYSIVFPIFYDTESLVVEIYGVGKNKKLNYDLIGKVIKSSNSNIADEGKIVIAQTYFYNASNEIYLKQLSVVELFECTGEVIWHPSVIYDFYLMNKVICKIFNSCICNANLMTQDSGFRLTI